MRLYIAITLTLLLAFNSFAQENAGKTIKKLDKHFNKHLSFNKQKHPVANILVYLENEDRDFTYHKAFGQLSVDNKQKVEKDSPFKIASITKMFTAVLTLQLIEDGKLKKTDKVYDLLSGKDFVRFDDLHLFQGKSYGKHITVEQLLSHRSGLADIFEDTEKEFIAYVFENSQNKWTPKALFDWYYKNEVNKMAHFIPNDNYYYSDTNYFLLGLIIEELTKKSLADVYRDKILKPVGMKHTYFEYYEPSKNVLAMPSAYIGNVEVNKSLNTSYDWAGGGLVSTTHDLSLFVKALFEGKLFKNKATLDDMTKSYSERYGLGINFYRDKQYFGHFGFWGSGLLYNPKEKIVIVISFNQADLNFDVSKFLKKIISNLD